MKIKHITKFTIILFSLSICCSKEKDQNKPTSNIPIEKYKKEILMNGNIDAYKQLTLYYLNSPFHNETFALLNCNGR
jgi:hypothetical protein